MTQFSLVEHHQFLTRHAEQLSWYKGFLCPCGSARDAARANANCTLCHGAGTRYDAPKELLGIVTDVTKQKTLLEAGIALPGDLLLGLSPFEKNLLSSNDLIEMSQWKRGQPFEGELLERSPEGPTDTLLYRAKEIFRCFSIDPNTQTETVYQHGTDFTVSGAVVTWIDGRPQPPAESIYSINYSAVVSYHVFVPPQDRLEGAVNLGQKALLRAKHVVVKP
jgi:hypothetical protein